MSRKAGIIAPSPPPPCTLFELVRMVREMEGISELEQRKAELIDRNNDLNKSLEYRLSHSPIEFILGSYFLCNYSMNNKNITYPTFTAKNRHDIALITSLENDIENFIVNYPFDFSSYDKFWNSTRSAYYSYQVNDEKIKILMDRYAKNKYWTKLVKLSICVFLNRQLAILCYQTKNYDICLFYYEDSQLELRFMALEDEKLTPIQKDMTTLQIKKIACNLADKIWYCFDDENILMKDTVANLLIEKIPSLKLTSNLKKISEDRFLDEKIKQNVNLKLKNWFDETLTTPQAILDRGAKGATNASESKKRHELLKIIKTEMKLDFESSNSKIQQLIDEKNTPIS